jgi:pimeloyl-ACP methyl ester carboxylesterase
MALEYDTRAFARAHDGTKLFYGVRGSGSALTLLDGIGCDGWAWNHIQPHLCREHRVVHIHYRGHGRSGPPVDPSAIDIGTLSDDVLRVLDAAQLDATVLLAHSMGTQVAFEVYRRAPARVAGLVLICGSYGRITHTFHGNDRLHRMLPTIIAQVRKHEGVARALWGRLPPQLAWRVAGWLGEINGRTLAAADFRQYVEHLSDIDLDVYLNMLQQAGEHTAEDLLPSVAVPTLVIGAERDTFTPVDVVREVVQLVPGAEYLELKGASHAAPAERADAINERIDAFLQRIPRT